MKYPKMPGKKVNIEKLNKRVIESKKQIDSMSNTAFGQAIISGGFQASSTRLTRSALQVVVQEYRRQFEDQIPNNVNELQRDLVRYGTGGMEWPTATESMTMAEFQIRYGNNPSLIHEEKISLLEKYRDRTKRADEYMHGRFRLLVVVNIIAGIINFFSLLFIAERIKVLFP